MKKEFNLSDKRTFVHMNELKEGCKSKLTECRWIIREKDVREFIKEVDLLIWALKNNKIGIDYFEKEFKALAGEKLTK